MKKFLIRCFIFFLILALPFSVLNGLYKRSNFFTCYNEMYNLKSAPDNITLLNLGNSHEMKALRYLDWYGGTAHNYATSSQPLYYSYQVLVHEQDKIADGAVVLIPVSLFDWYYDYESLFSRIKTYNNRYYSFLRPGQMLNFDLETYFECGLFPLLTAKDNVKYVFHDTELPPPETRDDSAITFQELGEVAASKYDSWCNDVMGQDKDALYADNLHWLCETIDFCYEQGWTPVMLSLPVTMYLTYLFGDDFMADFHAKNAYVQQLYPDLLFLDYSADEKIPYTFSYFADSDHLNSVGGDMISRRILHELVQNGLIAPELELCPPEE